MKQGDLSHPVAVLTLFDHFWDPPKRLKKQGDLGHPVAVLTLFDTFRPFSEPSQKAHETRRFEPPCGRFDPF